MVMQDLIRAWHRLPFAKLCAVYIAGILAGDTFHMESNVYQCIWVVAVGCLLVWIILFFLKRLLRRVLFPFVWHSLLFLIGFINLQKQLPQHQSKHFQHVESVFMKGTILEEPIVGERTIRFPVRVEWLFIGDSVLAGRGVIMLSIVRDSSFRTYHYGDRLVFRNRALLPSPAYNPKQFDYKRYLQKKGIYQQAFLKQTEVQVVESGKGFPLLHLALSLRNHLRHKFNTYLSNGLSYQISTALLFGYRESLDSTVRETFSQTGTVHVLAVSGLHVGLLFYILNFVLRLLDHIRFGRTLRLLFIFFSIWSYVFLTGMAPAILRAGIMISFFIFSALMGRQQNKLNTLFASAFFILFLQPNMLFDLGFQLSYAAMLGIFTCYPLLKRNFNVQQPYMRKVLQYCYIAISAQLFTAPLVLYYFQQFPNLFLLGNLLIALPVSLIMYSGIALALSPSSSVAVFFSLLLDQIIRLTYAALQFIAAIPFAVTTGIDFDGLQLFLAFLFICCFMLAWQLKNKILLHYSAVFLLLVIGYSSYNSYLLSSFQGVKLYNSQRDVNLALINKGRVTLYSTLDSLSHPRLKSLLWPDLQRYGDVEKVRFQQIPSIGNNNYYIASMGSRILMLNQEVDLDAIPAFDILLWRIKKPFLMRSFPSAWRERVLLLDGFQSSASLQQSIQIADSLQQRYYVLKDNFAYVWDSNEDGE